MKAMTRYSSIIALTLAAASGMAFAQANHTGTGVVKKIDAPRSTVTLAHEPIRSLNWPAMVMDFQVRDKAGLAKLKPGQKVEFELIEEKKGSYAISRFK